MTITIRKALREDCPLIHAMQVEAFSPLLERYQDYDLSPAAESMERIFSRFDQRSTEYWIILADAKIVGALRVVRWEDPSICGLSPIFVLPRFQGRGVATEAFRLMEARYPCARSWRLDSIVQEEGNCRLYERIGYRPAGVVKHIKEGMDIAQYEKRMDASGG